MIPEYYEFQNRAKILSGVHAIEHIPFELQNLKVTRPFIVTDKVLNSLGILKPLLSVLDEFSIPVGYIFDDVPVDSSVDVVNEAAALYKANNCDGIIAVGGGSVIDTAKGINLIVTYGAGDLMSLRGNEGLVGYATEPFVAIPTTSGTGSEATGAAVIKDPQHHVKMPFNSFNLLPHVAVLDPRMTAKLPARITSSTGLDALTHAVEAFSSTQKNPISDGYATAAIEMVAQHLVPACEDGSNVGHRVAMANAALLAGTAFSNAMVGAVHAIGHACGGVAGVAHGDAMGILLPHCMEFNKGVSGDNYARLLLHLAGADAYAATPKAQRADAAIAAVRALLASLATAANQPTTLSQCGVTREQFADIAQTAINDGSVAFNPRDISYDDVLSILDAAL